jgi:N-acetylglutamate synthase-like GNAT family acetyltransferase
MKIRAVTKQDIPKVIRLIGEVWAEYDCVFEVEQEETHLLAPDEYFRAREGGFWVAENNHKIVATVAVQMLGEKTAELKSLYVHKDFRREGLGQKLTEFCLLFAKSKGAKEMILWTDTRFTDAHRLYERLGFKRAGYRELDDLNQSKEFGFKRNI